MSLYITLLITFAGCVGGLLNPYYGLLAYVAFAILKPDILWSYNVPAGNYSLLVGVCMLLGWLFQGFGSWKLGRGWAGTLCLILHVGWIGVGTFFVSTNFSQSFNTFNIMLKILLPFLVAMTTIRTIRQLQILAMTMTVCVGFLAYELNYAYYIQHFNILRQSTFIALDNNGVGVFLAPTVGVCFVFMMDAKRWLWRLFFGGLLMMLVNAIFFSNSRGTMLATGITAAVGVLLVPKRPIHYLLFLLVMAASVRLAGEETVARFSTIFSDEEERDSSAQSRLEQWAQAMSVMWDNPLVGVGPGQWMEETQKFSWGSGLQVHSTWIQNGAEGGLFAFVILPAFYLIIIYQMGKLAWAPTGQDQLRPTLITLARAVTCSLCGFMVAAQFVTAWPIEMPYYLALVGALVMKLRDSTPPEIYDESLEYEEEWYEHDDEFLETPATA